MKKKLCIAVMLPLVGSLMSMPLRADDCTSYLERFYDTSQRASSIYATVQSVRLFHDGNVSVGLSAWPNHAPFVWGHAPRAFEVQVGPGLSAYDAPEGNIAKGDFNDFFPSRMESDLTNLALFQDGRVRITLKEEGNQAFYLEDMQCHGDQYHFMLEGKVNVPPYTSTWAFRIKRFIDRP